MISITLQELVVWLILGAFAGMLSGMLLRKKGSRFVNLIIGLIGAVIGGYIFETFKINLKFENITVDVNDLIAATVGALVLIIVLRIIHMLWNYIFKKMDESLEK